ncbi:MAG: hypothetical protein WBA51_14910 [Erythrobacter sp.]
MAAIPSFKDQLNLREQIARIDKTQADIQKAQADLAKIRLEVKYYPGVLIFQGAAALAAILAAAAAIVKIFA